MVDSVLDFKKAWKKKKLRQYVDKLSLQILAFCKEYGFSTEVFMETCEERAVDGRLHGITDPVSGEIVMGFYKSEGMIYFVDAADYAKITEASFK